MELTTHHIATLLREELPFEPTEQQAALLEQLSAFLQQQERFKCFVLKGYAGTGKTTILGALIRTLPKLKMGTVQLAPTGRAAKVIAGYSGQPAYTIHKKIYFRKVMPNGWSIFDLAPNPHKNTVFIVDEASMISNSSGVASSSFEYRNFLQDLLNYVYRSKNCFLILVGDTAQLPPVGYNDSPALDVDGLLSSYDLVISTTELTQVVRQAQESEILVNATNLRNLIAAGGHNEPVFSLGPDVRRITGLELQDELESAYANFGADETMMITRSNKRANIFNQQIRNRILYQENELEAGDVLMIVKNNYFWLDPKSKIGFLANGDVVEVLRIANYRELYGFNFADVTLKLKDQPDEPAFEAKLILESIHAEGPALKPEENKKLMLAIGEDYMEIADRKKRNEKIFKDPYFNALQVKFGYAVTCHKAQGGQWACIFIDQGYLTDEMLDLDYYRWLYTAFTRASERLYLVNFNERFFES